MDAVVCSDSYCRHTDTKQRRNQYKVQQCQSACSLSNARDAGEVGSFDAQLTEDQLLPAAEYIVRITKALNTTKVETSKLNFPS